MDTQSANPGVLLLRVDATVAMGSGHAMRCLALAQAWQDGGGTVLFAMAQSTAGVSELLKAEGKAVVAVSATPGSAEDSTETTELANHHSAVYTVLDGYHFTADYQRDFKQSSRKLLCIDDTAPAQHYFADIVLNQNLHACDAMYAAREPQTRLLLGPRFALLRREFAPWREFRRTFATETSRVLVTMGGSDPENFTLTVMRALQLMSNPKLDVTIVVGGSNLHYDEVQNFARQMPIKTRVLRDVSNMPELMAWADVAISAAGSTCWELCLLGLPSLLVDVAPNQHPIAVEMDRRGAAVYLGLGSTATVEKIAYELDRVLLSPEQRSAMSEHARALVDGRGAERVRRTILAPILRLRSAVESDCKLLWDWVNDADVRAASFSSDPVAWETHKTWFANKINSSDSDIFIAGDEDGKAVGLFRVDWISSHEGEIAITVSREHRGSGYGAALIALGSARALASRPEGSLHAFMKVENLPSRLAFERAGFLSLGEETVKGHRVLHYIRVAQREIRQSCVAGTSAKGAN